MDNFNIENEEWEEIEGYWGKYLVSNLGRVYNTRTGKFLKAGKTKSAPYPRVSLNDGKKVTTHYVHRLVATYFVPNLGDYETVNHIDENTSNNHADNLEWCTMEYNANYGTRPERTGKAHRVKVKGTSLDGNHVIYLDYMGQGAKYGFKRQAISLCCKGKYSQHKGYRWEYV